jgi:competence protein ComEC
MFFWTPFTFVRIVLFFIAGILLGIYQPELISVQKASFLFIGAVLGYFFVWFSGLKLNPGFLGLIALLLAGYLNTLFHTDSRKPDHILHADNAIQYYRAVITSHAEEKEKSWKTEARILATSDGQRWSEHSGKVLLYFSRNDFDQPFYYGDEILIKGAPQLLRGPANPGEFDYKRFLTFRKIYHQHFVRRESVLYVTHNPPSQIIAYSINTRLWAEKVLNQNIQGKQERAVAFALILGVKDGLDNDLVNAYASSGAMHVLAVSGLHVGIIYAILLFLFKPLRKVRYGLWMLALLSIMCLWSYAFVTGLSPSVLRAVTMFSFLALARPLKYGTNIFNTLAVSAFCLLMWEPYMIMSVGFQLSFSAVIGIVYLQPKLYQLWIPKRLIWDKVWQVTCVSFAAQLATFSLGILYFHQFPVYFLVSNLFVIPGALVSLCLGIALLVSSILEPLANIIGMVLEAVLWLLNFLVFSVEALPFSLINNIYISTSQSWMILGFVISVVLLFHYRKFMFVYSAAVCALFFSWLQWEHHHQVSAQPKFVVYQVNGNSAMEWVHQGKSYFFTDSVLAQDRERLRFHIRPNRLIHGIHRVHVNDPSFQIRSDGVTWFRWHTLTVAHITSDDFSFPDGLEVDYLVVSNNAVKYLDKLSSLKGTMIILDSSNAGYIAQRIVQEGTERGVPIHSVLHDGAFIKDI